MRLAASLALAMAAKPTCKPPACVCNDECRYSRDGECDDSGPGSDNAQCPLGTDCTDCGERREADVGSLSCDDSCVDSRDGGCDDGGPGSKWSTCTFGTDCDDCGHRAGVACKNGVTRVCTETCLFAADGRPLPDEQRLSEINKSI